MTRNDGLANHLDELYKRHRELDDTIKNMYSHFAKDEEINRLKTKKLWLKDEIHRLETELKAVQ